MRSCEVMDQPPVLVIQAGESGFGRQLRELWQARELLYILAWRDFKVRYKQTVLGAAWALIQPLFTVDFGMDRAGF